MSEPTRAEHWEKVYAKNDMRRVSWYQDEPVVSRALITAAGPALDAPIIDVGAGTSRLAADLLNDGYTDVTVLDISGAALDLARTALGQSASRVRWIQSDVTAFAPVRRYALWHDRAVLHFLTGEADQRAYVSVLRHALLPGAQVIIGSFAVDGPNRCSGLDTMQYDADRLRSVLGAEFSLLEDRNESHATPSGVEQRFSWFRLRYSPAQ